MTLNLDHGGYFTTSCKPSDSKLFLFPSAPPCACTKCMMALSCQQSGESHMCKVFLNLATTRHVVKSLSYE